jgi:hypothetical protein
MRFCITRKRSRVDNQELVVAEHLVQLLGRDYDVHAAAILFNGGDIIYFCTSWSSHDWQENQRDREKSQPEQLA